jgi:hypothetical protein
VPDPATNPVGRAHYVSAGAMPSLSLPVTQVLGGVAVGSENSLGGTLKQDLVLPSVPSISGSLLVNGSFSAPNLTQVGGDAVIGGATDLPALATIGGTLSIYEDHINTVSGVSTLSLPALQSVGSINIGLNTEFLSGLGTVSFPVLTTVPGTFQIINQTTLTQVTMPKLASVGAGNKGVLTFTYDPTFPQACAQKLFNQAVANGFGGTLSTLSLASGACPY